MFVLPPWRLRDLHPACPPTWTRLGTLIVIAGLAIVLLRIELTVLDAIVVIGAVSAATVVTSGSGSGSKGPGLGAAARAALFAAATAGVQR